MGIRRPPTFGILIVTISPSLSDCFNMEKNPPKTAGPFPRYARHDHNAMPLVCGLPFAGSRITN